MQIRKACAFCSYMYAVSPKPFYHATISRDGQFVHILLFDMKFALFLTFVKKKAGQMFGSELWQDHPPCRAECLCLPIWCYQPEIRCQCHNAHNTLICGQVYMYLHALDK